MIRLIAINLLLILAPFILYAAYVWLEKKPATSKEFWQHIPLLPLFLAGTALMFAFMVTQISTAPAVKDGIYHPPIVKDGVVIPGHVTPYPEEQKKKPDDG